MNMLLNFDLKKMIYTIYLAFYKFLMKLCVMCVIIELKNERLKLSPFLLKGMLIHVDI